MPRMEQKLDKKKSSIWAQSKSGLLPLPVKIGGATTWVEHEVDEVLLAEIAGKSEDDVRALVRRLHEARKAMEDATASEAA